MTKSTVRAFLVLLTSKITQADATAQKRAARKGRSFNVHALPLMLGAAQRVEDAMRAELDSDAHEALERLSVLITAHFTDTAPARATLKQLDECITLGRKPHLLRGEIADPD